MAEKKGSLRSRKWVLQDAIRLDDREWTYDHVPDFPGPKVLDEASLVKTIGLVTEGGRQCIRLGLEAANPCRATAGRPRSSLVVVSLADFRPVARDRPDMASGGDGDAGGVDSSDGGGARVRGGGMAGRGARGAGYRGSIRGGGSGIRARDDAAAAGPATLPGLSALQPSTNRECADYATRLLREGVRLGGVHYNFYGHSNSQLKSRACYLMAGPADEVARAVEGLGDFAGMKTAAKMAKRIGLLFSAAEVAMDVSPERCEDIADVESPDGGYVFTDGCGLVAPRLAQELARRRAIVFRARRYTPSVLQIRYRGYKGVVTADPRMGRSSSGEGGGRPTLLKFRKSMRKFGGGDDHSFAVVEHSRPYVYGHLNDEVVTLLDSLGVPRSVLLRKQREHLDFLEQAVRDQRAAFRFLSLVGRPDLAERLLLSDGGADAAAGQQSLRDQVAGLVRQEHGRMLNKREGQRCRILVPRSRLLFGVADAWGVLREGECSVRVTHDGDGVARAVANSHVLVTRNPCLHPGDLQKLVAVDRPELAHLVDCIVFPTKGRRPAADMMSGGDLDGDTFFVCWDPDLIPSTLSEPAHYPGVREPVTFKPITREERLVYFARYNNASLGRVKNLYLRWAAARGPMSPECQALNRLFSQCVDGNRVRVPPRLEEVPEAKGAGGEDGAPSKFVLDELHEAAQQMVQESAVAKGGSGPGDGGGVGGWTGSSLDAVEMLLSRDDCAIGEFELAVLAARWCRQNRHPLEELLPYLDCSALTTEQQAWLVDQLPPSPSTPSLVVNALCSSDLVTPDELARFRLDLSGVRWKRVHASPALDRPAAFLDAAAGALETFHRKLVVLRVDARLTVAMYVPRKVPRGRDVPIDGAARLFAFPHSQGPQRQSRLALPTTATYRLYCDGRTLQLFRGQRADTWIYVGRAPADDAEYRDEENKGNRRRKRQASLDAGVNYDFEVSIALQKFGRGLQDHVGQVNRAGVLGAEVYVITNRDVRSMQTLDLWLDYIDTDKRLPLFDQTGPDYSVQSLADVDWALEPAYVARLVKQRDLSALDSLESAAEYERLLGWLLERDQKGLLLKCFDHLLSLVVGKNSNGDAPEASVLAVPQDALLDAMVLFLNQAPFLALSFGRNLGTGPEPWPLPSKLAVAAGGPAAVLRAYVLAAHETQDLVLAPLEAFLERGCSHLTLAEFAGLARLVALTVRPPELAMDMLLAGLERQSERLLGVAHHDPALVAHFVRNTMAVALEHAAEAAEESEASERAEGGKNAPPLIRLRRLDKPPPPGPEGGVLLEAELRIDAPGPPPEQGAHVRLVVPNPPINATAAAALAKPRELDALVIHSEPGRVRLQCLHPPPAHLAQAAWRVRRCGSFVSARTMLDALLDFAGAAGPALCPVRDLVLGAPETSTDASEPSRPPRPLDASSWSPAPSLNASQNGAVRASLRARLVCLWGPPGTGKTETIVHVLRAWQAALGPDARILVAAPSHNAVDNAMRRYLRRLSEEGLAGEARLEPLRVSTEVRRVAPDLRKHTCDSLVGESVYTTKSALREARRRLSAARVVFTTCIGAGLGLLRSSSSPDEREAGRDDEDEEGLFDAVVVDEASQLAEPAALVPLVKGAARVLLVGDHVQLRPTTRPLAAAVGLDVSLFERLWRRGGGEHGAGEAEDGEGGHSGKDSEQEDGTETGLARRMLDAQYRMHPAVCAFSSREFYGGRLKSGVGPADRPLFESEFPWPSVGDDRARMVFVPCESPEDLGHRSKSNSGQAELCARICRMLCTAKKPNGAAAGAAGPAPQPQSVVALVPYTRQADLLKRLVGGLPAVEVASVDGFQGREADVVLFCSVRCNGRAEIGFLRDLRRLNVALTRARAGLILVGDRATLTGGNSHSNSLSDEVGGFGGVGDPAAGDRRPAELSPLAGGENADNAERETRAVWRRLVDGMVELRLPAEEGKAGAAGDGGGGVVSAKRAGSP